VKFMATLLNHSKVKPLTSIFCWTNADRSPGIADELWSRACDDDDGANFHDQKRKNEPPPAAATLLAEEVCGPDAQEMKRLRQLEEENSKLKRIVADLSLDKAMLQDVRMFCQKSSKAWPQARACRQGAGRLEGLDQAGLFDAPDRSSTLRLQVEARRPGRSQESDQGDLRDACEIRLSPGPCPPAA
jgi:putative transposase